MGKLIVFEGTDGTGKSTQFALLTKRLQNEDVSFRRLQFPQYLEPSSALIRMYLNGEFGDDPNSVNAYAASTFYAVDRYASYQRASLAPALVAVMKLIVYLSPRFLYPKGAPTIHKAMQGRASQTP